MINAKSIYTLATLVLLTLLGFNAEAATNCSFDTAIAPPIVFPEVNLSVGEELKPRGTPLTDWHLTSNLLRCGDMTDSRNPAFIAIPSSSPWTDITHEGEQYRMYNVFNNEADFPLGVIFKFRDTNWNGFPVRGGYGDPLAAILVGKATLEAKILYTGLKPVTQNHYVITGYPMAIRIAKAGYGNADVMFKANGSINVKIKQPTCVVRGIDQNVDLGKVSVSDAPGFGNRWPGDAQFSFKLDCPSSPNGINVHALFTDAGNKPSTSNFLVNTAANGAYGTGVQISHNGKIISFGPESSKPDAPGAFSIYKSPAGGATNIDVPFKAYILQGGATVKEGNVSSAALVTLTYD